MLIQPGDVPAPARTTPKSPAKRVLPPHPVRAAIVIGSFTALLYLIEFINMTMGQSLDRFGIQPRTLTGLEGVVFAPLLHASWAHLIGNTIPILVFGFLAMAGGITQWVAITTTVWVVSGLGVWATGSPGVTVGASGVAFGWLAFLLLRGLFNRSILQVLLALVLLFFWGSILWGLLPLYPGVSWQGHAFGALGGVLAAWLVAKASKPNKPAVTSGPAAGTTRPLGPPIW